MTFVWPNLLWLIVIPLGLLAWDVTRRRRRAGAREHPKIIRAEMGRSEVTVVGSASGHSPSRVRPWLAIGFVFAIFALARPQWGRIEEPVFDQSREILLALDLSRSMLSTDVKPSRLERAKLLIQALLEKLQGERVGLVVFSGTAFLQSPLSSDYEILQEFMPALKPDFLPEGGTNYRALIDTALDAFGTSGAADRFLIILSDGEATEDDWRSRVDELKNRGIRVIGLGVGTSAGSMIPDGSGGFVKDERGAVVLSKLESGTLQQLADATHGTYRDASAWIDLAALIDQTVNAGKKGSFVEKTDVRYIDRFQWPLGLALWCFLVSLYYEFPVRPRTRQIALRTKAATPRHEAPSAGIVTVMALLVLVIWPRSGAAAVKIAPPGPVATGPLSSSDSGPALPSLGRVVERLSAQDALSAADLSELAHETLSWGRRLKDGGQAVPPGPVHDALQAVDRLQAQGDNLADWGKLKKELEALLEKPPERKPPPQPSNQQQNQQKKDQSQSSRNGQQKSEPKENDQRGNEQSPKPSESRPQSQEDRSASQGAPPEQQSAFGSMGQRPTPPPPASEMQKVGGADEKKGEAAKPTDPALAIPLEKLEQLKNADSPAQLYELMHADRSRGTRKKPAKDW